MIELRSLGTAEIHAGSATLTPAQDIAFAAALYLIVERGKPLSRSRLMSLLWPEVEPSARSHRLRQTIYQLKSLGIVLHSDRQAVTLPREFARSDVDDFSNATALIGDPSETLEFLPGYHPQHSDAFERWLDGVRERVHCSLTDALIDGLRRARNACSWADVESIAAHCLHLDPYNEAAVLARAEAYAMRGQKAAALSILNRYVEEVSPNERALVLPAAVLRRRILQNDDAPIAKPLATSDPEFVGRTEEMKSLSELVERTAKGCGGGCLIVGEPGIGKTRLSLEVGKFAELQGFKVERVSCKRSDVDQPLSAFVSLVPKLRELRGALGCSRETLAWLTRLTEFNSPKALQAPSDDSSAIYTFLRTAVFDLLDAISEENSVLVVVEDVQWLDRASTNLFGAILEWAATKRIFFLFNTREDRGVIREAVSTGEIPAIQLRPLGAEDSASLARALANEASGLLDESSIAWLINAAEGNPYFLQELIKHRLESGHRHTVPPSVATVLDDRVSRLSEVARHLLQACAVLLENSNLDRLEKVLQFAPHSLLAGIQELYTCGMLRAADSTTLVVRHDLLSIQVLSQLAPMSLAYLHRRCALALESEASGSSAPISILRACAFHWYQAGDSEKAYALALKCADHLLELGLATDSARAYESAFGFSNSSAKQIEVLTRIVHANRMAKDWCGVLKTIARTRVVQNLSPTASHDEMEIIELEALGKTEVDLTALLARTMACVCQSRLSAAHRVAVAGVAAKLASAIPDLDTLRNVHETVGPLLHSETVPRRDCLQFQLVYHTMCGDLRKAVGFAKDRVSLEREEGTVSALVGAITDLAFVLRRTGPPHEMFDALRQGYDIASMHNHYAAARECAQRIGSLLEDEEIPGSEKWMELSREPGERADIYRSFSYNADSVRIALREARLDDARRILESGFDWEWLGHRRVWLFAVTGLHIRLLVAQRAAETLVAPHLAVMLELYPIVGGLGRQDYEIAALERGLAYVGKTDLAKKYLANYGSHLRRDLTPLSHELSAIVQANGLAEWLRPSIIPTSKSRPGV